MPDGTALERAARSILQEELALLEKRIIDHLDWLEERLHWISQQLESVQEAPISPDPYPSGGRDRALEAILGPVAFPKSRRKRLETGLLDASRPRSAL